MPPLELLYVAGAHANKHLPGANGTLTGDVAQTNILRQEDFVILLVWADFHFNMFSNMSPALVGQ